MGWKDTISGAVGGIVSPIANIFAKKQDRKKAEAEIKGKIALAKQEGKDKIELATHEWEAIGKNNEGDTWKDEYVTLVITLPIVLIMLGSIYMAFTGDNRLLDGINTGITNLATLGLDMGELMYVVVLAAVGIKGYKSL